jgi:O-methyltransferase domain/Dimerisation domain
MSTQSPTLKELAPQAGLMKLTTGHWITQGVFVAAKLGIADLLQDGPQSSGDLAQSTGTNPRALYRLLRALASVGVFAEGGDGRFALTPMSECLRADTPGSMRAWVLFTGEPYAFQPWGELLDSVRTGQTAFDRVHGMGIFEYYARHPEQGKIFDAAMTGSAGPEIAAVIADYDFSGIGTLVDLGGGHGSFLGTILKAYPAIKGVLAEMPAVIDGARRHFEAAHLADRCEVVPINFFESVPTGGDAYVMKRIIHDWDDERSITILKNCHQAMAGKGKLLLVEMIIPPGNDPEFGKWLDIAMLVFSGGCERTEREYRDLLTTAGFRLTRIVPTRSSASVIEAMPV